MPVVAQLPIRIAGELGTVTTDILISNRADEIRAEANVIGAGDIRSVRLDSVLVDTGASTLCLPSELIAQLGLTLKRQVLVTTAAGDMETGVYMDAHLHVAGRSAVVECVALPEGARPLLGVIPMEMMGLEPDLKGRVLPDDTKETYILAF
jgi:predicted aspartyl protease